MNISGQITFKEIVIDLIGALVPGVLFIFLASITILWPVWGLLHEIKILDIYSQPPIDFLIQFTSALRVELTVLIFVFCYVLGFLFYRLDPNKVDQKSFQQIANKIEDIENWVEVNPADDKIEFPYKNIKGYLKSRGLAHLANIIPWSNEDKTDAPKRSKQFINSLKIKLYFSCPEKVGHIIRNEAHIRLLSSVWYSLHTLQSVTIISIALSIADILLALINNHSSFSLAYFFQFLILLIVFVLFKYIQKVIQRFFHYMRVREILHVLEVSYLESKNNINYFDKE